MTRWRVRRECGPAKGNWLVGGRRLDSPQLQLSSTTARCPALVSSPHATTDEKTPAYGGGRVLFYLAMDCHIISTRELFLPLSLFDLVEYGAQLDAPELRCTEIESQTSRDQTTTAVFLHQGKDVPIGEVHLRCSLHSFWQQKKKRVIDSDIPAYQ